MKIHTYIHRRMLSNLLHSGYEATSPAMFVDFSRFWPVPKVSFRPERKRFDFSASRCSFVLFLSSNGSIVLSPTAVDTVFRSKKEQELNMHTYHWDIQDEFLAYMESTTMLTFSLCKWQKYNRIKLKNVYLWKKVKCVTISIGSITI